MMNELNGAIALVTGASRGIGRGIAHGLGMAGATVYVTGRSRDQKATTDDMPGTIDETARLVSEAGGRGQYDVVKAADNRLGFALAQKFKSAGITALTVHPGFTRTERVLAEEPPPEAMAQTHSPRFVGRAIVALAADPDVMRRTGGVFKVGTLGLEYGFTDVDGTQPEPFTLPEADTP